MFDRNAEKATESGRVPVTYFLSNESGLNFEVCQTVFLATLGLKANNNTFVHDAVTKEFPSGDGRGRHRQSNKRKFDSCSIVVEHIIGFHHEPSHYRREHAPHRLYLPSDVTILKNV